MKEKKNQKKNQNKQSQRQKNPKFNQKKSKTQSHSKNDSSLKREKLKNQKKKQEAQQPQQSLRILITGGANGIGNSTVQFFAKNGHRILSVDIDETSNKKLQSLYPSQIEIVNMDITDPVCSQTCIQKMIQKWKGIDVLINNAAVQLSNGTPLHNLDLKVWEKTLSVNLTSYFLFSKACIPQMLKQASNSSIINISSIQGLASEKGVSAYAATKGAILSLTKQMAIEYAPKIRVNAICPGTIETPLVLKNCQEFGIDLKTIEKKYPMKRIGQGEDISQLIYFLAREETSGFITGSQLVIDGGIMSRGNWAALE